MCQFWGVEMCLFEMCQICGVEMCQDQVIHNPFMWAVIFIYGDQYVSSLNPLRWLRAKTDKKEKVQRKGLLKEKDLKCKRREINGPFGLTWKINICFSVSALTCTRAVKNLNWLITFRNNNGCTQTNQTRSGLN